MENVFEENLEIERELNSNDYPGVQVPPASAGIAVIYGVVGGIISSVVTKCTGGE